MPRKPRVEFAGALYPVMCRGDRREAIFLDDEDRLRVLDTMAEVRERSGWLVHAYVLMGNHYHLLLETPEANLVEGMRWFQSTYTIRFTHRHGLSGHLFQGRYKALVVDPAQDGYFLQASTYIHLNPVRAKLVRLEADPLSAYRWSSYPEYLKPPRRRGDLVQVERVLGSLGLDDHTRGRTRYAEYMQRRAVESVERKGKAELEQEWKPIRRGWYLGSEEFGEKLVGLMEVAMSGKARSSFSGPAALAHDEAAARSLLRAGLAALDVDPVDLKSMKRMDVRKQVIAWWVRK